MATGRCNRAAASKLPVQVCLTPLGRVVPRAVGWLWPKRVPLGKVTLLVGDPGRGKSLLALDMAARVTRGLPWPDEEAAGHGAGAAGSGLQVTGSGLQAGGDGSPGMEAEAGEGQCVAPELQPGNRDTEPGGPKPELGNGNPEPGTRNPEADPVRPQPGPRNPVGSVMLLSAEDDAADTIRPRFEAAGGDPDRVVILRAIRKPGTGREGDLPFSLSQDLAALEAAIKSCQDVRLVVLDPVSAYLAGVDTHSNADVREVLAPLQGVAERTGVAVVAISHLTKRAEAAVMYRAMGSLAFVAAARAVWAVGPDRQTAGRLLFLPVKCNLAGGVTGLAYRIVPSPRSEEVPVLAWEAAPVAMTAEEALDPSARRAATRRGETAAWLAGLLSAGPMASKEIEERAWEAGFSKRTLVRAKEELDVVAFRSGFRDPWMWRMPEMAAEAVSEELTATVARGALAVTGAIP